MVRIEFDGYKLLALLPLAYIVWWFYTLATWLIPIFNTSVTHINWTLGLIIGIPLFLIGGIFLLIVCCMFIAFILIED